MADNAAQAIKDLKKNIESLDVSLDKTMKSQEKYTQMIVKMFQEAAKQGMVSVDDLLSYIGKQTKSMSNAMKIKWQIDLGTGKKGELEQQIANLKSDITKYEKSKDTHAVELLKQQLKDLEVEYKELANASKKSAAQMYDDFMKIVNAAAGVGKDDKGTAWSQARAKIDDDRRKTIDNITKAEQKIIELQEKLGKYKEGSKNWEKTNKEIEKAKSSLQQYQDKLNRLQGRKVEDASAKAIKVQVTNMRELYNLNKQYQQMLGKKRQGLLVNPQDLDDTKRRLREILDVMKKIETEHPGSRKTAAARLETERLRDRWKEANRETKANRLELDKMLPTLQRLASAFGVAFSIRGLAQFGKKLIETRGEFEMQFVAMKQIIGDVDAATKIWSQTMQMALQSPFKAMQLVDYTKKLAAYRIETEKLFDTTKRLADVSAGLGVDMQRLILAYGQVKAANYLRASEIRQFTEAGVNILGELAEYLTVVNGKMYTTATVMEMVTKRMIKFEDVEAIFKRMTDEGGIFFNMQEVQVDTVRGQMMKLQDAFDQMLNKIGSANQGTLREFIDALNSMVRNWQTFATFLKTNATLWLPVISVMKLAQLGLTKYGDTIVKVAGLKKGETFQMKASLVEETLLLNKNAKTITAWGYTTRMAIFKVEMAWKALTAAFKAFLPFLVVEGIVYIASAIANANKELDEFRNSINDFATDAESRLGESQKRFKELREELEKTTKGTEARREAVQKMNNQFGKYLNNLVSETMTLEELKAAYEGVEEKMVNIANLRLREEIKNKSSEQIKNIMQNLIEDMEGEDIFHFNIWKQDKEHTGVEKVGALSKKQATGLTSAFVQALQDSVESLGRGLTKEELEDLALATYNKYLSQNIQEYSENIDILTDLVQKGRKINDLLSEEMPVVGFDVFEKGESWKTGERQWREYLATQKESFDIFKTQLDDNIDNIEDYRKRLNEEIEKYDADIAKYAKSLAVTTGYAPQAFSFRNFYYEVEPFDKNKIPQSTAELEQLYYQKGLKALKEMYPQALSEYSDDYAKAAKIILASTKDLEEGSQKYEETVKKEYKTEKEYLDWLKSKGDAKEEEIAQQEALIKIYEKWAEIRDIDLSDDKKGRGTDTIYSDRVRLLQRMFEAYKKASKEAYSFAVAEGKVKDSFEYEWANLMPTGYGQEQVPTSYDALKTMLERLKEFTPQFDKNGKLTKAFKDLMAAVSDATYQVDFKLSVEKREEFQKQIEEMFNNYELTLDLEKLSLPTGDLARIFQYDFTSLDMLRNKLAEMRDALKEFYNPEDAIKMTENLEKKIDDMERKALVNRLKTYTAYLEKGRDEAVKIHLDELKKMAELDSIRDHYTPTQYKDIQGKIKKETDEALAKNRWEQFKKSDFYITMFQDLNNVADVSIDIMIEKLKGLMDYVKELDPKQVKEIVKALDKLEKTKRSRTLFGTFSEDKELKNAWLAGNRPENELPYWQQQESYWQQQHDIAAKEVAALQEEYDILSHDGIEGNETKVKKRLEERTKWLNTTNKGLERAKENSEEITNEQNEGYAAWVRYHMGVAKGAQDFSNAAQAAGTIATEMMDMFDQADNASKKLAHDLADIAVNAGLLVADIAKAIASKGTDVGAMVDGILKTWNIIKSGLSASEQNLNRTIDDNKLKLEELEITLGRVEKARDKAWDTQAAVQASEEMKRVIEEQKKAYQALINAENAKKSTDEDLVRQYERAIDELDEALEDEKNKMLELFGGLGENAYRGEAQNFVDAWKEAFLETGDGLQGLQDHFDEFLNEWFVKQATMRMAGKMLQPLFEQIDRAVDQYNAGGTSVLMSELNAIREKFGIIAPQLSDALEALAGQWGLDGEGGLSGLAAGIQGMTEEQANILESYWNSVRGYTASIDMKVSRIVELLSAGGVNTNPQLQQLELIAHNTASIQRMFESVVMRGHTKGQSGIRVFVD